MARATESCEEHVLIESHLPVARQVAARLKRRYTWLRIDDLYSYALYGLTMAASTYESDRGVPFANFASQKAMFGAIDEMRKDGVLRRRGAKSPPRTLSLGGDASESDDTYLDVPDRRSGEAVIKVEARDLCTSLLERLIGRDRHLLIMYYAQNMTYREIACVLEVSESSVCLRHKAILRKLRRLGSHSRFA